MDKRYTRSLANPFSTRSNRFFPKTIKECFDWAQYMHDRFPVIGKAISKVVRYFASDISITSVQSPDEVDTEKMKATEELLKQNYNILQFLIKIGQQLATMGNVFVYAMPVINRTLCCPQCDKFNVSMNKVVPKVDFDWVNGQCVGVCPECGKKVTFKMVDRFTIDQKGRKIRFMCYSARDMELKFNELTGEYTYIYKMPNHIKTAIVQGDPVYLRSTPKVFLKAAFTTGYIMFPQDKFLHIRTDTLSTMDRFYKGWGTPLFLSSFNNVLRLAYMDKFNEAVATDFIAPIRMISPPTDKLLAGQDQLRQPISGHAVKNFIMEAIKGIRQNPSQWVVSPFPLNYQMLGGQAKQLAPVQLMKWCEDRIMQDMSIPVQLRQTTFQAVGTTMGLRMFERQWIHFTSHLDDALQWLVDKICQAHLLDQVKVRLDKTSFVQDDMHKQTILNMAGSGMLSSDTVLGTIGLDFQDEFKKQMSQEQFKAQQGMKSSSSQQEAQMTMSVLPPAGSQGVGAAQYNMQMVQQANMPQEQAPAGAPMGAPMAPGGAPAPGAAMPTMPAGQGNSQSAGIQVMYQQAQDMANQIFQTGVTQGQGARRRALVQLKNTDPTLHAQVKAILQQFDQQTASQAVAQSKMPQGA